MRKALCIYMFLFALIAGVSSCKKGCTNPKAFNYDKSAKEEDASCTFCDSVIIDQYDLTKYYIDNTSGSIHQSDQVLKINVNGDLMMYEGNSCREHGFFMDCYGTSGLENFTYITCTFTNLINDTLILTAGFKIQVNGSTSAPETHPNQLYIPPLSSVSAITDSYFSCLTTSSASVSVTTLSTPHYSYK